MELGEAIGPERPCRQAERRIQLSVRLPAAGAQSGGSGAGRGKASRFLAFTIVAGAFLGFSHFAGAQPMQLKPGADLRPLYATSDDIAEGRQLAKASCAACHGAKGVSRTNGIPNLAGQRPAYLYRALKDYQSGARPNAMMRDTVKFLSTSALVKVAAYYASLPPAEPAAGPAPAIVDPVRAGKAAAAACAGCHGAAGVSKTPGIPNLVGQAPKYLLAAMKAYRSGGRKNATMKAMVGSLGAAEMNHIALYYALQKPARAKTPAKGDPAAGKAAATACAGCHGKHGVSGNPATPSLAGQDAGYLAAALDGYKTGRRSNATMAGIAKSLDAAKRANLAAYYAAQEPQAPHVVKPLTPDQWAQKCDRCHGIDGNSPHPNIPALASQRREYLETALHDYQSGVRHNPLMAAMSAVLSAQDIKGLAAHYAHEKARAVVFVMVPSKK